MLANAKIYDRTGDPEDHVELLQISSFMSSHKCPELSKRFSGNIPKTVDDMLKRVDDYLWSKEAFRNTELPKGEFQRKDTTVQWGHRNDRNQCFPFGSHRRRPVHKLDFSAQEHHAPYIPSQRPNQEFRRLRENKAVLTLDSLVSTPQEILATEHQLRLPQPASLMGVPNKENLNKYCGYHNEKGHSTNDFFHLKKQLEIALESGKLNHLVKDVRQRGRVGQQNGSPQKGKALVVEVEEEGYLIRRVHIDEGAFVEIMFEQCFNMLHPSIRARRNGKKQAVELPKEIKPEEKMGLTEQVLVNPAYPEQLVAIGKGLSPEGSTQLKNLLKKNKEIFAWEPSDMTGVQKRIIKHSINTNPSVTPSARREGYFALKKAKTSPKKIKTTTDGHKWRKTPSKNSKNDYGPASPYNSTLEGNIVHIPSGIRGSSQCSAIGSKERKAVSGVTHQPFKQILSKADNSGKLAYYSVELGAYNIAYEPRSAIKGHILADFLNEVPVASDAMVPRQTPIYDRSSEIWQRRVGALY
uniref:Reverse transcriptase domain-containing protein n=1 Tax=Tanacetum cinerariifolium TaxID=118510 RepID=A0A6L2KXY3_TANCI|nr:reverse transcriptase domain-containing protein [Tanacetum cinerariifolium]